MKIFLPGKFCHRGLMLMECLVYVTVLVIILGLAFSIFYQCQEQSVHLRRQSEHVAVTLRFGERWRNEVSAATDSPYVAEQDRAITFHLPQADGEIVYLYDGSNIYRKAPGAESFVSFVESIKSLQFHEEKRNGINGWRLELELMTFQKNPRIKPLFSFLSVSPN